MAPWRFVLLGFSACGNQAVRAHRHVLTGDRRKLLKDRQLARCQNPALADVVERNIEAIEEHRLEAEENRSFQDRFADSVTRFAGSVPFVYFHILWFAAWLAANLGIGGLPAFDPYPFGMLTTIVSLEAIFLSTFVLVSQNRQAAIAERRAELDLQINLLAEYEVTRILTIVDALAKKLKVEKYDGAELKDLEKDVKPEDVLEELDSKANGNRQSNNRLKKKSNRSN
jgi:uncharacterized membrane protein